jgi:flagellar protein FliO/FliZ
VSRSSLRRHAPALASLLLVAASAPVAAIDTVFSEPVGLWELAKVTAGLLVVLVVIVATAAGLKRLKSLHAAHGSHIKIIDGVSVSTRDRVVLLEVDRRRVLLGISPSGIQQLHVFTSDAASEPSFVEVFNRTEPTIATGDVE